MALDLAPILVQSHQERFHVLPGLVFLLLQNTMFKKTLSVLAVAALAVSAHAADVVLKVAATPVPHAEILNFVKPKLKAEGVACACCPGASW